MKTFNKTIFILIINLIFTEIIHAQINFFYKNDSIPNFYKIRDAAEKYFDTIDKELKGCGWKPYKRWEWFWEPRVYPTGEFPNSYQVYNEIKKTKSNIKKDKQLAYSWTFIGPQNIGSNSQGLGRVNCVRTDPQNTNIIWACAASGGLWKTTDNGNSWTTNTDELSAIGMTDLVFHPTNNNIMYLATGDGDHSDTYSIGVLKSTDGGNTWNTTGLIWNTSTLNTISRLLINPDNPDIVLAAGNFGVYRTTNGGQNWTRTFTSGLKDMEFKPGNPNVVYACGTRVYRSNDGGVTWSELTSGLPTSGISRIALAVTPANAEFLYAIYANSSNNGFMGLYRSTNSGNTWSLMSNSPNILGWSTSNPSGQAWYDLCLAVSPTNANEVFSGGVDVYRSTDGGINWTSYSSNMHVDHHDLWFIPNTNILFSGNDGGVYRKTVGQNQWTNLSAGLKITQFYRLGCSATNSDIIAGSQDNGTFLKNSSFHLPVYGGDGMEAIIDYSNSNIMYACSQNGGLGRSTNGGSSFTSIKPSSTGAWVTPYEIHPTNPQTLFAGYLEVYKTTNRGNSWTTISSFGSSNPLTILEVCKSNPNYIYVARSTGLFRKTTNGGTSWSTISYPYTGSMTSLEIHPENPNIIWTTFSGYNSGNKVFYSTNAGSTWTNISGNLPNVPANCIVYEADSPNRVYVGTDIGVWYRDDNNPNWIDFNNGLPNVVIDELEIQYSLKKIRAATYGRGLWEADLISVNPKPEISGNDTVCAYSRHTYKATIFSNTSYRWYVTNGTIVGANNQDSVIIDWYSSDSGSVKLVQINELSEQSDSTIKKITIIKLPIANIQGNTSICANSEAFYATENIAGTNNKWYVQNGIIIGSDTGTSIKVLWDTLSFGTIKLVKTSLIAGCKDSINQNVVINPLPKPMINGNRNVCINEITQYNSNSSYIISNKWYVDNGRIIGSSEGDLVMINWDKTGTNKIKLVQKNTVTNCKDSIEIEVNVQPSPIPEISGNFNVCQKSVEIYRPADTTNLDSFWEITGGTILENKNNKELKILWDGNSTGTIKLKQKYRNSPCIDSISHVVIIYQLPNPDIRGENYTCEKTIYEYSTPSEKNVDVNWEVEGGEILSTQNKSVVTVKWNAPGQGKIKINKINSITGCKDSSETQILISNNPIAVITGGNNSCYKCRQTFSGSAIHYNKWEIEGGTIVSSDTSKNVIVLWDDFSIGKIKLINTNKQTGCKDSTTKYVSLYKYKVPEIIGDKKCCQYTELPYTIEKETGLIYEWYANSGTVTRIEGNGSKVYVLWNTAGTNTLLLIQKLQDSSYIDSVKIEVIVIPQPDKPVITQNGNSLISSYPKGNIWYFNDSLTTYKTQTIFPKKNGKYKVQYYDENGCLSKISDEFDFTLTEIILNKENNHFIIYPNPADRMLYIKLSDINIIKEISISNILGQRIMLDVKNMEINNDIISIPIESFSEGIYFIHINNNETHYYFRVLIKH